MFLRENYSKIFIGKNLFNLFICDHYSCALEMETAHSCETSVNIYQTTLHHIPEDSNFCCRYAEGLKYHILSLIYVVDKCQKVN